MASQRSKQVDVKLGVDGDVYRLRVACKGHLATTTVATRKDAVDWLAEQFDDQLTKLKEVANGTTR